MENANTKYKVNEKEGNAITVRTPSGTDSVQMILEEDRRQKAREAFENDTTVRYSDCVRRPADKEDVTVRLTEASFESQPRRPDLLDQERAGGPAMRFESGMIDPVAVVLSERDESHTQMPRISRENAIRQQVMKPVGWLICVEGPDYGACFPLKSGKNTIGRSDGMDVVMKKDLAVSRKIHALIEYHDAGRHFTVSMGDSRRLAYLNDDLLLTSEIMKKNDLLMLGDSTLMLIPCCDEKFCWADWDKDE